MVSLLAATFWFLMPGLVFSDITVSPVNQVIYVGEPIAFNCELDNGANLINWYNYDTIGTGAQLISNDASVTNKDFIVTMGGSNCVAPSTKCALLEKINSSVLTDGNKYLCQESGGGDQAAAVLVVLEGDSTLDTNLHADGYSIEHDVVDISCAINYGFIGTDAEKTAWNPKMTFTRLDSKPEKFTITDHSSYGSQSNFSISIPVTRNDHGASYSCETHFDLTGYTPVSPAPGVVLADNTPDYSHTLTSPTLKVWYPVAITNLTLPEDTLLYENATTYKSGDQIACLVDGSPEPTVEWFDLLTNETSDGSVLRVPRTQDDDETVSQYRCIARNTIRDVDYIDESNIIEFMIETVPTTEPPTDEPTEPPTDAPDSGLSGGAIAGIVIGCLAIVGGAVVLVIVLIKKQLIKCSVGAEPSAAELEEAPSDAMSRATSRTSLVTSPMDLGSTAAVVTTAGAAGAVTTLSPVDEPPPYTPGKKTPPSATTMPRVEVDATNEITESGTRVSVNVTVET